MAIKRYISYNNPGALTIPTYDGSGETVHPDVFDAGFGQTWSGWRYWMAITPYPAGDSTKENPSIVVSNDGSAWQVPAGLTNPVAPAPALADTNTHNADPDLVINGANAYLFYAYRDDDTSLYEVHVRTSTDGVNWSDATVVLSSTTIGFASPSVYFLDGVWHMWSNDYKANPNVWQYRISNSPTSGYGAPTSITFTGMPAGRELWHADIIRYDGRWLMLANTSDTNTSGGNNTLNLAISDDGISWKIDPEAIIEVWSPKDSIVYRGSVVLEPNRLRIWYSSKSKDNKWMTALSYAPLFEIPA